MAGITGKNSLSIKKLDVQESKIPAIGFNKIVFMHKAAAADTEILLSALSTPAEAVANGFAQPNLSILSSLHLQQFRENFTLKSSLRGTLQDYLSYKVVGAAKIQLLFDAEDGEIFTGVFDYVARTGNTLVDAQPLVVTGQLDAGETDFNVGTPFQVGQYSSMQVGAVMVFVDNQIMYRNDGNNPPGIGVDGDYYEVHAGSGLGTIIRFNTPDLVNDRGVIVVSVGSLVERPIGSQLALIEALAGQIDNMIPTLAASAGVPETDFQGAPNNVDLKAFGDRVLELEQLVAGKEDEFSIPFQTKILSADVITDGAIGELTFNNLEIGKVYRVGGNFRFDVTAGGLITVTVLNGAQTVGFGLHDGDGTATQAGSAWSPNLIFVATATTLTFVAASADANSPVLGNTTRDETFVTLEELPQHVATSQWT